ncbi:HNH endonuclease [Limosilactobacillus reuteri]
MPLEHGGTNEFKNLMALCKPCHSRITARWMIAGIKSHVDIITKPRRGPSNP